MKIKKHGIRNNIQR
ncbi:hypothetical protein, partial [Glaesserella parasuis]